MSRTRRFRISVCCVVLMGLLAGGMGIRFGIRHRHDGGDTAHSHGAGSKGHGGEEASRSQASNNCHVHSHASGHGHQHVHSHSHSHSDPHSHTHAQPQVHDADQAHSHESSDGTHVHVTFLGFELTLPDWFPGEPAPLYSESAQDRTEVPAGEVVDIPDSFGLASFLQMFMDQVAIRSDSPLISGPELPAATALPYLSANLGLDAAPPLVPPPRFM